MMRWVAIVGFMACTFAPVTSAADEPTIATIVDGLQRPCCVAIRPAARGHEYEIYVADAGSGRVVRVRGERPGAAEDAITGFASPAVGDDPFQSPGPRGLIFLDRARLVVTGGDRNGRGYVRLYEPTDQPATLPVEQFEQQLAPAADLEKPVVAVRSFHGPVRTIANQSVPDLLIVAALGEQASAGLWKVPLRAGTLGEPVLFASAQPADDPKQPLALAVGPHGHLVASAPAATHDAAVTRLKYFNPIDGSVSLQVPLDLPAITSLAFSPRTGNLYATVFEATDEYDAGIYRIDDASTPGQPSAVAVKIAEVSRPTALAFAPEGDLYVTSWGELDQNETNTGLLLKLTGEL